MKGKRMPPLAMSAIRTSLEMGINHYNGNAVDMLLSHIDWLEEELQREKENRIYERMARALQFSVRKIRRKSL